MTDNFSPAPSNLPEYTVSELSAALKRTVEDAYGHVRVRGELSGCRRAASGHWYMSLKDETAVIDAVCWRGTAATLALAPEDGLEVVVTGRLTTYAARSRYQIVVEAIEVAGEGALLKLLEDRRKRLAAEGLFDAARKQPRPFLPEVIGVVTSPTGAVIRDILHRLADRFPRHVLLWPVLVQGDGAAEQVAAAIRGFNALAPGGPVPRPDLLIVARGGGSLEDLWAFNEEAVVRAAAESRIPLISAVGHETDVTLIDFAADLRAPTPTAAAELAVPVRAEILARVLDDARRLVACMARLVEERRMRVEGLARGLPDPARALEAAMQRLDDWSDRLVNAMGGLVRHREQELARAGAGLRPSALRREIAQCAERVASLGERLPPTMLRWLHAAGRRLAEAGAGLRPGPLRREISQCEVRVAGLGERLPPTMSRRLETLARRLAGAAALLEANSYARVLDRGFVLVRDEDGRPVTRAAKTRPGMPLDLRFADGEVDAVVGGRRGARPRPAGGEQGKADGKQGRLL